MSHAREVLNTLNLMIEQSPVMKLWQKAPGQQRETDHMSLAREVLNMLNLTIEESPSGKHVNSQGRQAKAV